ncbi:Rap1 GTPase-GDP dissociation stimulator 1 [Coemansia sp. RSA 518]|nr:Rap1 GTPase-GDP dissociation stimulator 1 [Coemansia sp. RSA 518]KAJ2282842.1 Rap1 GTPase-GDP dissociation stimulator 1 [Coemansia sp. RSA 370]
MVISTKAQREGDASSDTPVTQWLDAPTEDSVKTVVTYMLEHPSQSISSTHIVATAKAFKQLADMCRDPDVRTRLADGALAAASSLLLERVVAELGPGTEQINGHAEHVFLLVQVLRCICNQSADTDAARTQLLEHGGTAALARALNIDDVWRQPVPVAQAAFGAVLNVSLDHKLCTQALVDACAIEPHISALRVHGLGNGAHSVWPLVCSSLDNLCEDAEAAATHFEQHAGLASNMLQALAEITAQLANIASVSGEVAEQFVQIKEQQDADVTAALRGAQRTLLWNLCEVLEKSSVVRLQLCEPVYMHQMFDILAYYVATGGPDEPTQPEPSVAQPPSRPLPQGNRNADATAQMIVGVSGEDAALSMFDDSGLQQRLFAQLAQSESALAAAAALCLGNLARTDAHCTQLAETHPDVVQAAIAWFESGEVRVRHAASGLLKNLCVPAPAKARMVELGLPAVAARNVDTAVVPVQANAIGILRHLANGCAEPTVQALLAQEPGKSQDQGQDQDQCALARLLTAVRSTDIDGIRCEGTRLVAAVAKAVYLKRACDAQDLEARGLDLVAPLVRLVVLDGQRHPLLQQESLVALTVLVAASSDNAPYAHAVVRCLVPETAAVGTVSEPTEDEPIEGDTIEANDADDETAEADDAETTAPDSFTNVLKRLLTQSGPVWPQSTMQAKSLITQLTTQLNVQSSPFDPAGLDILRTEILPLTN